MKNRSVHDRSSFSLYPSLRVQHVGKSSRTNFHWLQFYVNIYFKILTSTHLSTSLYDAYNLRQLLLSQFSQLLPSRRVPFALPVNAQRPNSSRVFHLHKHWLRDERRRLSPVSELQTQRSTRFKLFTLYLKFANGSGNPEYGIPGRAKSIFLDHRVDTMNHSPYLNINRAYTKWIHTYNFLLNIFYARINVLLFTNRSLRVEALSFNWSYDVMPYSLFKRASPFFFLRDQEYGAEQMELYFKRMHHGYSLAFVADIQYQKRAAFFLKSQGVYTISIVPYTFSPWSVHYSIPVASSTLFTQYFFVKLVAYFRQHGELYVQQVYRSLWRL